MWITKDSDCRTIRVWKNKPVLNEYNLDDDTTVCIWEAEKGDTDNVSFVLHETYVNYFEDLGCYDAREV